MSNIFKITRTRHTVNMAVFVCRHTQQSILSERVPSSGADGRIAIQSSLSNVINIFEALCDCTEIPLCVCVSYFSLKYSVFENVTEKSWPTKNAGRIDSVCVPKWSCFHGKEIMKNFVERMGIKPVLIVPVFIVSFLLPWKKIFWNGLFEELRCIRFFLFTVLICFKY